jgi:hypothetical protein
MTHTDSQPVSVLHEGPVFADEFAGYPQELQQFRADHGIEQRRFVPAKSAASGVHTVYFRPEHREWALVRLARRYRWAVEIQLLRGMSGERQLLRGGFTPEDLEFLADIVPEPSVEYSPVVYDLLWLAATTEEYVHLASAIRDRNRFRPRAVLTETDGLDLGDAGYLTRFLRSHLVREAMERSSYTTRGSNPESGELQIDLDTEYEVTREGRTSLEGIVEEYHRIFDAESFQPLLVDPNRDPVSHLQGEQGSEAGTIKPASPAETAVPTGVALDADGGKDGEAASAAESSTKEKTAESYTDDEIAAAVRAACTLITAENVARSESVKRAVWETVDPGERSKSDLWDAVLAVLLETDAVNGRPGGRIWTARRFSQS